MGFHESLNNDPAMSWVAERGPMHSIIIRGGLIIDGTGDPAKPMDVAIDGTRIVDVRKLPPDAKGGIVIDATGMVVCPGFIDIHSHSDIDVLAVPMADSRVMQGVTTELVGNCGGSAAPITGLAREAVAEHAKKLMVDVDWVTMDEYLLRLANLRTSVNVASLVGADTLRLGVIGANDVKPTDEQMQKMRQMLADAMLQGAFGVSSGLIYAPGMYASTEELVALASTAGALGGIYASHIRGESRTVVDAVAEAIAIGRQAGCRVEISHHKACGKLNWGLVDTTLKMIENARAEGVDVAFDVYPYTAAGTYLEAVLPPWVRDGGSEAVISHLQDPESRNRIKEELGNRMTPWENSVAEDGWESIYVCEFKSEENRRFENRPMSEIARELGKDPADAAMDLLIEEKLGLSAIFHDISEDDMMKVLKHPLASIGSDGAAESHYGPTSQHPTHPRSYGTFPRVIRRYCLDKKLFPLEEAIRKMTSWPAQRIGLEGRGVLAKDYAADIVIFDPERIEDTATFEDSHRYPKGIEYVLVNGAITVERGKHTKERAGQVLRNKPRIS